MSNFEKLFYDLCEAVDGERHARRTGAGVQAAYDRTTEAMTLPDVDDVDVDGLE